MNINKKMNAERTEEERQLERIAEAVRNGVMIFNPVGSSVRREESRYVHRTRAGAVYPFPHAEGAAESFLREEIGREL